MSKLSSNLTRKEKKMCRDKIKWLATIGFELLPGQTVPRLVHPDLPGEVFDVLDLNPVAMVKRIYDLGEAKVQEMLEKSDSQNQKRKPGLKERTKAT